MENVFELGVTNQIIDRINKLNPDTKPGWGKMNASQMLAHCNVTYELIFENKGSKASGVKKFLLKLFIKNVVVGAKPYSKNGRTAPDFLIEGDKDFAKEKKRLIAFVQKVQELGQDYFDGRESHSFGALTGDEWNNMFYKHLDHHLSQFGV